MQPLKKKKSVYVYLCALIYIFVVKQTALVLMQTVPTHIEVFQLQTHIEQVIMNEHSAHVYITSKMIWWALQTQQRHVLKVFFMRK